MTAFVPRFSAQGWHTPASQNPPTEQSVEAVQAPQLPTRHPWFIGQSEPLLHRSQCPAVQTNVMVLNGNGDGSLSPVRLYGTGAGASMCAGDLNGEGIDDLAAYDYGFGQGVRLLMGTDGGTMFSGQLQPVTGGLQLPLAVDMNRDGKRDLIGTTALNVCILIAR